ncbi:glycosyl transferase family group 2-domain-containing protein [Flammula alnicola]|nr:glycosyl transferase family group 2-domain-containing protein [Flammula alnicola]
MASVTIYNADYDLWDAWLHKIYESTQQENWFMPVEETVSTGVAMRVENGFFRVFPYENPALIPFEAAVRRLNPVVAVKIRNTAVQAAIRQIGPNDNCLYIDSNTRIQILDTIDLLPQAEKDQCAAFIRDERSVVLWSYNLETMIPLCKEFEEKLIKHIWRTRTVSHRPASSVASGTPSGISAVVVSPDGSQTALNEKVHGVRVGAVEVKPEREEPAATEAAPAPAPAQRSWWSWRLQPRPPTTNSVGDVEKGGKQKERKLVLIGPVYAGLGAGLAAYFMTSGVAVLLEEYALDHDFTRFALIIILPVIYCVSIFFCLQLVGNICLILGPVAQYHENSMFYSAIKPEPNPEVDRNLPHITIQLPVYKESLELTIAPSVYSVKKAMQTYARQGGTSAIFICDDGLQLIKEEDRKERIAFYANHNIGWVARPGHSSAPDGFKRAGKFKKASNMNYGLALSLKLEKFLAQLEAEGIEDDVDECLEDKAMKMARDELFEESGRKFEPWSANGKSIRMGEIILIIDADTIVPEDCFRDAAREMFESPDVAIIQHESDVMQVANHYFENGITHFTRRINKCISLGCANGEVAPFVGHNAFLRWSAVQDAAFIDPADNKKRQWSEANVSEDFDLALRLLLKGYNLRWATYSNGGFKEGVSLTVVDELARWQKYAYGCNEIIFNPIIKWWRCGPISPQLRGFVWSKAPLHYKVGMMSYMFSYCEYYMIRVTLVQRPVVYGIAAATVGSILNYLLLGLALQLDRFYLHSFEILLACTVVFPGIGNVGYTLLEYRLGQRNFFAALFENLRWIPFFLFFFGGMSIHLSTALLAHLFSYDMTWGSTGKEVELSSFWIEVPRIWQRFKLSFMICFACIAMMVIFTTNVVPFEWQIAGWNWALIIPLSLVVGCHILVPIVLNPWLMIFSY